MPLWWVLALWCVWVGVGGRAVGFTVNTCWLGAGLGCVPVGVRVGCGGLFVYCIVV